MGALIALDDWGATSGAWMALVRRARIGPARKFAALVLASYASAEGTNVHCGVARLALDLECSHRTAQRHLKWLRDVGLLQLVRRGNKRRGRADEYRLTIGPDLLEHIDVPDPAEYDRMQAKLTDQRRSSGAPRPVDNQLALGDIQVSPNAAAEPPIRRHLHVA